jgi:ABC-type multidrug transport system fused ATPase/permease subunit
VIVLNAGRVIESGSPRELMQNNSKFSGMVQAQAFSSFAG